MLRYEASETCAVDAARYVVARRNREKSARVVVESDCVVEPCCFGDLLAKAHHAFGAVVKPPGWSEAQAGIVSSERREFPAVRRLVKREKNDRELCFVSETI